MNIEARMGTEAGTQTYNLISTNLLESVDVFLFSPPPGTDASVFIVPENQLLTLTYCIQPIKIHINIDNVQRVR